MQLAVKGLTKLFYNYYILEPNLWSGLSGEQGLIIEKIIKEMCRADSIIL